MGAFSNKLHARINKSFTCRWLYAGNKLKRKMRPENWDSCTPAFRHVCHRKTPLKTQRRPPPHNCRHSRHQPMEYFTPASLRHPAMAWIQRTTPPITTTAACHSATATRQTLIPKCAWELNAYLWVSRPIARRSKVPVSFLLFFFYFFFFNNKQI